MSSHAMTSLLLSSANDPNNSTGLPELNDSNVTLIVSSILTTLASATSPQTTVSTISIVSTTVQTSTVPSATTILPTDDDSHLLFGFCTILFFVGIALVMKIVYSNRKKYRNLAPSLPSWRLSASRASGSSVPAGFALSRDPFAPRTARGEAFGSAHYTAVPPSTTARLQHDARLNQQHDAFAGNSSNEWERQYFEDDAQNEDHTSSKLELRR